MRISVLLTNRLCRLFMWMSRHVDGKHVHFRTVEPSIFEQCSRAAWPPVCFFLAATAFRDPKPPLFVDACSCLITYKHGESEKCTDTVLPTQSIFCMLELTLQLLKKTHRFDVHRSHVRNLSDGVCFCNKFLCQRYTFGFSSSVVWSLR